MSSVRKIRHYYYLQNPHSRMELAITRGGRNTMGSRRNVIQWLGASQGYLEKGREIVRVPKSVKKRGSSSTHGDGDVQEGARIDAEGDVSFLPLVRFRYPPGFLSFLPPFSNFFLLPPLSLLPPDFLFSVPTTLSTYNSLPRHAISLRNRHLIKHIDETR